MNAVDSEFKKYESQDSWRTNEAIKLLFDQKHEGAKFGVGNRETLNLPNIRELLVQFYSDHYSADRMKLVVKGKEYIEVLEKSAVEFFGSVPKRVTKDIILSGNIFAAESKGTVLKIKTLAPNDRLTMLFQLPSSRNMYDAKTVQILSYILNNQNQGGLYYELAKQGLIMSISAYSYTDSVSYEIFSISALLTESGIKLYHVVVETVLKYLELLQGDIPNWILDDYGKIQRISYDYKESTTSTSQLAKMAEYMFSIPPQDLLSGPYLLTRVDKARVKSFANLLMADNMRIVLKSDKFDEADMMTEKWFGSKYIIEHFERINSSSNDPNFKLPSPTLYIPTNFTILGKKSPSPKTKPDLLVSSYGIPIWHKLDDTFMIPKANIRLLLKTNNGFKSTSEEEVWFYLFISMLNIDMTHITQDASDARLRLQLENMTEGFEITFSGFSDKLHLFMDQCAKFIANYRPSLATFESVRESANKAFQAFERRSSNQILSTTISLALNFPGSTIAEDLKVIENFTFSRFSELVDNFKVTLKSVQALAVGNILSDSALKYVDSFINTAFPLFKTNSNVELISKSAQLKESNIIVEHVKDSNHAVQRYIQYGLRSSSKDRAMSFLIDTALGQLPFQILRTEQALGYVAGMSRKINGPFIGLVIEIQSPKTNPKELDARIKEMIQTRFSQELDRLNIDQFEEIKATVIDTLENRPTKLGNEFDCYWNSIYNRRYQFNFYMETVKAVLEIGLEEFKDYVKEKVINNNKTLALHAWSSKSDGDAIYDEPVYKNPIDYLAAHNLFGLHEL